MKRIVLSVITFMAMSFINVNAQTTFVQGDKIVDLQLGLGGVTDLGKTEFPAFVVSGEYCVKDNIWDFLSLGVGGTVVVYGSNYGDVPLYNYDNNSYVDGINKYKSLAIGANASFHYELFENFDLYSRMTFGYSIILSNKIYYDKKDTELKGDGTSDFILGGGLGFRYYFKENMAFSGELGLFATVLNLGVSIKL